MLHIRPKYNNPNLKCYYCSHETPSEEYEETQRLYFIKSGLKLWLGYKYNEVEVHIPRCKECYELHYPKGKTTLFRLLWLICSALVFFFIYKVADLEPDFIVYAFAIIMSIGFGAVLAGIVAIIVDNKSPKKGVRSLNDFGHYSPINRLKRLGFLEHKPDPSNGAAYANDDITQDDITSAFDKIRTEDDCIITGL